MPPMTRNTVRTRRAVLNAAVEVVQQEGTGATLGAIASRAGVSKGGLLHHFRTREELLTAVVHDLLETLQQQVFLRVDLSENRPGKLLRGYVRALLEDDSNALTHFDDTSLWGTLAVIPGVSEILQADAESWRSKFAGDGLHLDRILVVQHAAEGLAGALCWDTALTPDVVRQAREAVPALTDQNGPLADQNGPLAG